MSDNSSVLGFDEKYCESCGNVIKKKAVVCPSCGVKVRSKGGKNKIVAALLALFLGTFGVHKFYLGNTGLGILYLSWSIISFILMFIFIGYLTYGILGIVCFIDFIVLLVMSEDKFDTKYNY